MILDLNDLINLIPGSSRLSIISRFVKRKNDPGDYEVGLFPEISPDGLVKALVRNTNSGEIMEYFFDDVVDGISISIDWITGKGSNYYIIKDGDRVLIKNNHVYMNPRYIDEIISSTNKLVYPKIQVNNIKFYIHRFIALVFVPNPYPEKYDFVNHKNSDKTDYKKENLEWCDRNWNNNPKNMSQSNSLNRISILFKNLSTGEVFNKLQLSEKYNNKYADTSIYRAIRNGICYHGDFWEIIKTNPTLNKYLSTNSLTNIWFQHPVFKEIKADYCGVLSINGKLTVGTMSGEYLSIKFNKKLYRTHRLLAECFFNTILSKDLEIDHIDTNPINNCKDNLKICNHFENSNNENSKRNRSKIHTVYSCDLTGNDEKVHIGTIKEILERNYEAAESSIHKDIINNGRIFYTTKEEKLEKLSKISNKCLSRQKQLNNKKK